MLTGCLVPGQYKRRWGTHIHSGTKICVFGCGVTTPLIYTMRCHCNGRRVSQKTLFIYALLWNIPEDTGIRLVLQKNCIALVCVITVSVFVVEQRAPR